MKLIFALILMFSFSSFAQTTQSAGSLMGSSTSGTIAPAIGNLPSSTNTGSGVNGVGASTTTTPMGTTGNGTMSGSTLGTCKNSVGKTLKQNEVGYYECANASKVKK